MGNDATSPAPPARPDLFVVARFLDRLWTPDGAPPVALSRSKLQLGVRLNYDVFRSYLTLLLSRGLVQEIPGPDGTALLHLTPQGRHARNELIAWLGRLFGNSAFPPLSGDSTGRPPKP